MEKNNYLQILLKITSAFYSSNKTRKKKKKEKIQINKFSHSLDKFIFLLLISYRNKQEELKW